MSKDIYLFDLTPRRALLCDGLQLIVARITSDRKGNVIYQGTAFVRHGREALLRALRRRGIEPTPNALSNINLVVPSERELFSGDCDEAHRAIIGLCPTKDALEIGG